MSETRSRALERGRRRLPAGRAGARARRRSWSATSRAASAAGRRSRWLTPGGRRLLPEAVERVEPPPRAARAADGRGALRRRGRPRRAGGRARAARPAARLARAWRPVAGPGRASRWSSPRSPATRSAAATRAAAATRPPWSPASRPGVTAKMVREGDGGTLHLANVHQLPPRPGPRGLGPARRRGRTGQALFVPDRDGTRDGDDRRHGRRRRR